jgi:hypothetical protein
MARLSSAVSAGRSTSVIPQKLHCERQRSNLWALSARLFEIASSREALLAITPRQVSGGQPRFSTGT